MKMRLQVEAHYSTMYVTRAPRTKGLQALLVLQ